MLDYGSVTAGKPIYFGHYRGEIHPIYDDRRVPPPPRYQKDRTGYFDLAMQRLHGGKWVVFACPIQTPWDWNIYIHLA